jgi:ferric-dicitrate binding protein FerR (iron transport regulator)
VNNYNEKLITTLEKGKVNVQSKNDSRILKPSQKAIVKDNSIEILDANILKDLAWKNKKFHFENDRLEEILFQIQNWYGVKTDYKKFKNHQETFSGTINRDVNLSQFLEMLSKTSDYNFSIQNNHLIIHNKHI